MAILFSVVLVSVLISVSINAELYKGNACTFAPTGELGVCEPLRSCDTARESLRAGRKPQTCSYEGTTPIVCCTSGSQLPPYPLGQIGESATTKSKRSTPAEDTEKNCPPMPKKYVKVEKRGQKAWDYCIDLATSVYPCKRDTYSLIPRFSRGNECAHKSTPLVVGGNITKPGEFPHMAALGVSSNGLIKWVCGGSLISNRWVLTAAHCLKVTISHVRLGGGDTDSPVKPETHFEVIERIRHEDYHRTSKYNDIALLKLDRDVPFSRTIRPACLHTGDTVNDDKAVVSGWGAVKENGQPSNKLLKTTVEKFSYQVCQETNPPKRALKKGVDDSTQICFGHTEKKQDTCQGDSGGPVMISNKDKVECTYLIIGITSHGAICAETGFPAIYTRVSQYVSWIERFVWP